MHSEIVNPVDKYYIYANIVKPGLSKQASSQSQPLASGCIITLSYLRVGV